MLKTPGSGACGAVQVPHSGRERMGHGHGIVPNCLLEVTTSLGPPST